MRYKQFRDGPSLSRLGMGAMRLPVGAGGAGDVDYEKAGAIIDRCMENGVNYYDTAYIYHEGQSEVFLGRALAKYPRESYYVADKYNRGANPDYRAQFAEQLARLGLERIDFYLIHSIMDEDAQEQLHCGALEFFDEMKREGRIRYLGFSFHGTPPGLRRLLEARDWDFVQIQLNYYDWHQGCARELYELLAERHIPVMVMEPAHGGLLARVEPSAAAALPASEPPRSQASWAMRFVQELPGVQVVLSGMSDTAQAEDNLATFREGLPLTGEERCRLEEVAHRIHAAISVACTGCRYCCPDCPMELDIPALLRVYNEGKIGGAWRTAGLLSWPEDKRPGACVGCGACRGHCPQSIDVPAYLAALSAMLKTQEDEE